MNVAQRTAFAGADFPAQTCEGRVENEVLVHRSDDAARLGRGGEGLRFLQSRGDGLFHEHCDAGVDALLGEHRVGVGGCEDVDGFKAASGNRRGEIGMYRADLPLLCEFLRACGVGLHKGSDLHIRQSGQGFGVGGCNGAGADQADPRRRARRCDPNVLRGCNECGTLISPRNARCECHKLLLVPTVRPA